MKLKRLNISSQLLIIVLAALVLAFMIQFAQAQSTTLNSPRTSGQQVLQTDMPKKSLGKRLLEDTSLSYYQQFLGPTLSGTGGETYNVFQEGRAPYQSFHAMSLRYQLNPDWTVGASIAASTAYGETTTARQTGIKDDMVRNEFFNARLFVTIPAWKTKLGNLFTTISYEAPTSTISREEDMTWGWVLTQSFAFNLPSLKWSAGVMGQYWRAHYKENSITTPYDPNLNPPSITITRQTVIANIGPYLNYRFNDKWQLGSVVTFDWQQRGNQTGTRTFDNNLEDRVRLTGTYFPSIKYISSLGLFTQANLDYTTDTQAFGAEVAMRF